MLEYSYEKHNSLMSSDPNFDITTLDYCKTLLNNKILKILYDIELACSQDKQNILRITKDPTKRSVKEKDQHKILNLYAERIIKLPPFQKLKGGSLFIKSGKIKNNTEIKNTLNNFLLEDIDFRTENYIAFCKYTSGEGGYQNDQMREAANFINHCPKYNDNIKAIILFGTFWTKERITQLRKWAKKKSVQIFTNQEMLELEGMSDE